MTEIRAGEFLGDTIWSPPEGIPSDGPLSEVEKLKLLEHWLRCARKLPFGRKESSVCRVALLWFIGHGETFGDRPIECDALAPYLEWLRQRLAYVRLLADDSDDAILEDLRAIQRTDFDAAIAICTNRLKLAGALPEVPLSALMNGVATTSGNGSSAVPGEVERETVGERAPNRKPNGESNSRNKAGRPTMDDRRWEFAKQYRERPEPISWRTIWDLWVKETRDEIECKPFESSANRGKRRAERRSK